MPVRDSVRSVCEMLGYDPYFLACEGRVVAVVAADEAEAALARCMRCQPRATPRSWATCASSPSDWSCAPSLGGERVIEELEDDPLPRIC